MQQNKTAIPTSQPGVLPAALTACRNTALNYYSRLFAQGFFPILIEQQDGMFRVYSSPDEMQ